MQFHKLVEELLESTSPLRSLYHSAFLYQILNILKSNKFECKDNENDLFFWDELPPKLKKYPYFMSAARVPMNFFIISRYDAYPDHSHGTIELDASKLSDNGYPIVPLLYMRNIKAREAEDRVLSKQPSIPNFLNYIKAVHVFSKNHDTEDFRYGDILKNSGKPCYIYDKGNDFLSLNKARAKELDHYYQ